MYNILVLGVSGNVSQGILKALKHSRTAAKIIGACVVSDSVGSLWCDEFYNCPYANDILFISWVIDICNEKNIDIVLTGVEENLYAFARHMDTLKNKTKAKFIVSDFKKLTIGQNKLLTCQWLKEQGFNYPSFAASGDENAVNHLVGKVGYPLVAKPACGKGSNGVSVIKTKDDLDLVRSLDDYIIQQYIGTEASEYTVGCYCDKNGNSLEPIVMQRWLYNGATWRATVVNNDIIKDECQKICEKFQPLGPMNIQLRLNDKGYPIPFEFNVRFSGTTPMRSNFGFRDVEAVIGEYLENKSAEGFFNIKQGTVYRYVNEVYDFNNMPNYIIDSTLEDRT